MITADEALLLQEEAQVRIYETTGGLSPLGDWHLVDLVAPLSQTAGGIHLPEQSQRNKTTAVVLASGPGLPLANGGRSVQWASKGDVVLLDATKTWPAPEGRQVFVRDRDLLAIVDGDDVRPLNDWIWVAPDAAETTRNGIALPDAWQRRRGRSGVVRAIGNGKVRLTGPLRGVRVPVVSTIVSGPNIGDRVHWSRECDAIAVGRHSCAGLLVCAEDLCAYEEASDAEDPAGQG